MKKVNELQEALINALAITAIIKSMDGMTSEMAAESRVKHFETLSEAVGKIYLITAQIAAHANTN